MSYRDRQRFMRSEAIQRVLERSYDRAAIGSLNDLRRAYEAELAAHGTEIGVKADDLLTGLRDVASQLRARLPCAVCGDPITDAKRFSRRYCSNRCRQQGYRDRAS